MDDLKTFTNIMQNLGLAELPLWTFSNNTKQPMNAKLGFQYGFKEETSNLWLTGKNAYSHGNEDLIDLNTLNQFPELNLVNRTIRADLSKMNYIFIDVEKDYDIKSYKELLNKLPIVYAEWSNGGGIHLILSIKDNIDKTDPFFDRTVVKVGRVNNIQHSGIEILLNQHYITFTGKIIDISVFQQDFKNGFKNFLTKIKEEQSITNESSININNDLSNQAPYDAYILAQMVFTEQQKQKLQPKLENIRLSISDRSYAEQKQAMLIATHMLFNIEQQNINLLLANQLTNKDLYDQTNLTYALSLLIRELLPYREKFEKKTTQSGLNYVNYTANLAMSIVYNKRYNKNSEEDEIL